MELKSTINPQEHIGLLRGMYESGKAMLKEGNNLPVISNRGCTSEDIC